VPVFVSVSPELMVSVPPDWSMDPEFVRLVDRVGVPNTSSMPVLVTPAVPRIVPACQESPP
jgi:hypothetical protein